MRQIEWTQEIIDFLVNNYQAMEYKELSRDTGIGYHSIRAKLQQLNLKKGRGRRRITTDKYETDQKYFKKINSNSTYILGFITADGHICTKGRYRLMFGLNEADIQTLEFIRSELCPTAPIRRYRPHKSINLNISGKGLIQNLIGLGLDSQKSGASKILDSLPNEHKWDFIRGFFDGDGCISYSKRIRGKYRSVEGSLSFANGDVKLLESVQYKIGCGSIRKDKRTNCYNLTINSYKKIKQIYSEMYTVGGEYMARKKLKFEQFFKDKESL